MRRMIRASCSLGGGKTPGERNLDHDGPFRMGHVGAYARDAFQCVGAGGDEHAGGRAYDVLTRGCISRMAADPDAAQAACVPQKGYGGHQPTAVISTLVYA